MNLVRLLHRQECQRSNKSMMAHSVELRVPYLDRNFMETAFNFCPQWKMPTWDQAKRLKNIEKQAMIGSHHDSGPRVAEAAAAAHNNQITIEKYALRLAGALDPPLLPPSVLWREKDGFSSGVGASYVRALEIFFEKQISDEQFLHMKDRFQKQSPTLVCPNSKEECYVRMVFEELFSTKGEASVAGLWRQGRIGMGVGEEWQSCRAQRQMVVG